MSKQVLRGPGGLRLELDSEEIYPDDPGNGTPALVVLPSGNTGTFHCVTAEGETVDGEQLSRAQLDWLDRQTDTVEHFLAKEWRRQAGSR